MTNNYAVEAEPEKDGLHDDSDEGNGVMVSPWEWSQKVPEYPKEQPQTVYG